MKIAMLHDAQVGQASSTAIRQVAATTEAELTPVIDPTLEIVVAMLFLVVVIAIHGVVLGQISKFFSSRFVHLTLQSPRWKPALLTGVSIGFIVALHFGETHLWAAALLVLHMVDNYRDAYFYVLEAYTTLGEGSNYLPDGYRLISPVIALTGLFTFGWSGSVLVYIVGQTGRLHAERSKATAPDATTSI